MKVQQYCLVFLLLGASLTVFGPSKTDAQGRINQRDNASSRDQKSFDQLNNALAIATPPVDKALRMVALRLVDNIRINRLQNICEDCDPNIVFEHQHRAYPQYCTQDCRDHTFPNDLISADSDVSYVGVVTCHFLNSFPMSTVHQRMFQNFSARVNHSLATRMNGSIVLGIDLKGSEIKSLHGPAIEGRIASGSFWRIEFVKKTGNWKAVRFIIEDH